jgi:hypothetical protein
MEHVVFHPGPDGSPAFRRFGALEDAVRFVEHLRNVEGVSEVSVHALAPVPLSFRAYYKVEVPAGQQPVDVPVQSEPATYEAAQLEPVAVAVPVEAVPVEAVPVEAVPVEAVPVEAAPVAEPVLAEPQYAEATAAAEQPSNGKRSLGFFAH